MTTKKTPKLKPETTGDQPGENKPTDAPRLNEIIFHALDNQTTRFDAETNLMNLADLFAATGWFSAMTPAQIAAQIIIGREFGFNPAMSLFGLKITPGNIIFTETGEAIVFAAPTDKNPDSGAASESEPVVCPVCSQPSGSLDSVAADASGKLINVCSAKCSREIMNRRRIADADKRLSAAQLRDAERIVSEPTPLKLVFPNVAPDLIADAPTFDAETPEIPVLSVHEPGDLPPADDPRAPDGEKSKLKPALMAADAAKAADRLVGDDGSNVAKTRREIETRLNELFEIDVVTQKLEKFDSLPTNAARKEMSETVAAYHAEQLAKVKKEIFDCIDDPNLWLKDAKNRLDYFAEIFIPSDPARWTYTDATILRRKLILDRFLTTGEAKPGK